MQQHPGQEFHDNSKDGHHASGQMGERGVSRPQMHMHTDNDQHAGMSEEGRLHMLSMHHMKTLWVYWAIILAGCWMVLAPLTFSHGVGIVSPSGGRSIWLTNAERVSYMTWSDIVSGVLLIIFGYRSLVPNRPFSIWICCFVGVWLSIAPLVFWAPTAASYINDTLVGMLVISLSILIPGMPNMIMYMKMGSEVPPGWSYNPSSWPQRWIMIVLGFFGFVVSRYLAGFQLGYITSVWDPFFGKSSEQVLNSAMSHALPVSDAAVGTLAYTFEFLMGFMGSPSRWRTMPWMVAFFGILVIPLGLVHIFLVVSQPVTVGAWCFFCLLAAGIMLPMIPLEVDEVFAMGQHMVQAKRRGDKFWTVFWKGGMPFENNKDTRSPELMTLNRQFTKVFSASVWGMPVPWSLFLSLIIGVAVVVLPAVTGQPIQSSFSDINHIGGAIVVVVSVISMGEVVRSFRYTNVLAGLALALLPWIMTDAGMWLKLVNGIAGVAVALLALPKGQVKEQYGLWTKHIV
ncbi:MAG: vitamin K epoxide reductase family protein [Flavisolibacter sp.]